ncbi:MAG: hypothetical protein JWP97_1539 [Labilithrix sp.]|nr:hypothetical protein [Labilithrix sp.]
MSDDENENHGIYRVDTIPPPDGEDDAYSAPTKVGPMADAAVRELMHAAERRAAELNAKNAAGAQATRVAQAAEAARTTKVAPFEVPRPAALPRFDGSPSAASPAPAAPLLETERAMITIEHDVPASFGEPSAWATEPPPATAPASEGSSSAPLSVRPQARDPIPFEPFNAARDDRYAQPTHRPARVLLVPFLVGVVLFVLCLLAYLSRR